MARCNKITKRFVGQELKLWLSQMMSSSINHNGFSPDKSYFNFIP